MPDELDRLLDDVEALAVPGRATVEGGIDARFVVVAYMIRCRDLLRAVRVLAAAGLERVVDPLVRSALELAATSGWLMTAPEVHFRDLVGATRRDLRLAKEEYESVEGKIEITLADAVAFLESGPEKRFPPMPERTKAAGIHDWYTSYRVLSAATHGTLTAALTGAQVRLEGKMVDTRTYRTSVLLVAAMTLHVVAFANGIFAWGREEAIAQTVARLNEHLGQFKGPIPSVFRARN
jgi:hypothetical protein